MTVDTVEFLTSGLELTYSSSTSQFTLAGVVGVSISGIGSLSVTFGQTASGVTTPGLVITNGTLTSLDMTINSDMTVDSVEFLTNNVELTYSSSTSQFTLAGVVGVSISGIGSLSVTFGQTAGGVTTPGLVVTNGTLTSLDMTINSDMTVDTVEFLTSGLEFTYSSSTSQFTLAGMVGVSISGIASLSVTFGHTIENSSGVSIGYSPGLVVTGGTLTSLDMTINSDMTVDRSSSSPTMWSSPTARAPASSPWLAGGRERQRDRRPERDLRPHRRRRDHAGPGHHQRYADLAGHDHQFGHDGRIPSSSSRTDWSSRTARATSQFTLAGVVGVSVSGIGSLSVTFGQTVGGVTTPGLVITNGTLTSLDMTINSDMTVDSVEFLTNNVELTYSSQPVSSRWPAWWA